MSGGLTDTEREAYRCPVEWCAYPMPHEHTQGSPSASEPPPTDWPALAARLAGKLAEAQAVARHWQGTAGSLDRELEAAIAEREGLRRALAAARAAAAEYENGGRADE